MKLVKKSHWALQGSLQLGGTVSDAKREYRLLERRPVVSPRGYRTEILTWQGQCSKCGDDYVFDTKASRFSATATCPRHRTRRKNNRNL